MNREVWLSGKFEGYAPITMPAAHALSQSIVDLQKFTADLTDAELLAKPNGAPSIAFHLRHIAGSIDRLLAYSRGAELSAAQFDFLKRETSEKSDSAVELIQKAVDEINRALKELKNIPLEILFEERFVGRQKLSTNVFGLLFHIAEHTARHVGQIITTAAIVRKKGE